MAAVVIKPISVVVRTAYPRPATVAACLPRFVERSSSARPVSSSARVCRTTWNMTIRHTPSWAIWEISLAVIPPMVSMPACRPDMR